jgi:hypothetical protein
MGGTRIVSDNILGYCSRVFCKLRITKTTYEGKLLGKLHNYWVTDGVGGTSQSCDLDLYRYAHTYCFYDYY